MNLADMANVGYTLLCVCFVLVVLASSIVITHQRQLKFISLFGKYQKTMTAGIGFKIPFVTSVDATVYTGLASEKINLNLKTKDQIMFSLGVNVQYEISSDIEEAFKAVYNIDSYKEEMHNIAIDCAISVANGMSVEDLFEKKDTITDEIKGKLEAFLKDFGIVVYRVLSDEPNLPASIEERNNNIIAAKRDKEAAKDVADKISIEKIGAATADGESVKIRMERLGEAREACAQKTATAVKALVDMGVSPDTALLFLNQIGEQDALVSASRNGATLVFHNGQPAVNQQNSADALLALKVKELKEERPA